MRTFFIFIRTFGEFLTSMPTLFIFVWTLIHFHVNISSSIRAFITSMRTFRTSIQTFITSMRTFRTSIRTFITSMRTFVTSIQTFSVPCGHFLWKSLPNYHFHIPMNIFLFPLDIFRLNEHFCYIYYTFRLWTTTRREFFHQLSTLGYIFINIYSSCVSFIKW